MVSVNHRLQCTCVSILLAATVCSYGSVPHTSLHTSARVYMYMYAPHLHIKVHVYIHYNATIDDFPSRIIVRESEHTYILVMSKVQLYS